MFSLSLSLPFKAAEDILPVMSWDTTKRVAFTWTLTGVDAKVSKPIRNHLPKFCQHRRHVERLRPSNALLSFFLSFSPSPSLSSQGVSYVVPSITVLYLTPSKQITFAWDFWNTDLLPPGPI